MTQSLGQKAVAFIRGSHEKIRHSWNYLANYERYLEEHTLFNRIDVDPIREQLREEARCVADFTDRRIAIGQHVEQLKSLPGYRVKLCYDTLPEVIAEKTVHLSIADDKILLTTQAPDESIQTQVLVASTDAQQALQQQLRFVLTDPAQYLSLKDEETQELWAWIGPLGYSPIDEDAQIALSKTIYQKQLTNSQCANRIAPAIDQFKTALAHNRIREAAILESVAFGERHDCIQALSEKFLLGQCYEPELADQILRDYRRYHGHILSALAEPTQKSKFIQMLNSQATEHRYKHVAEHLPDSAITTIDTVKQYLDLHHEIIAQRQKGRDHATKEAPFDQATLIPLEKSRDQLAAQIIAGGLAYDPVLDYFDVRRPRLAYHQGQHMAREHVRTFASHLPASGMTFSHQAQVLARTIKKRPKTFAAAVASELSGEWKSINLANWQLQQRLQRSKQPSIARRHHHRVTAYQQCARAVKNAWEIAMAIGDKKTEKFKTRCHYAQGLSCRRDQLASALVADTENLTAAFIDAKLDLKTLTHRARHHDYVTRYQNEKNTLKKMQMGHHLYHHRQNFSAAIRYHRLYPAIREAASHYDYLRAVKQTPTPSVKTAIRLMTRFEEKRRAAGAAWYQIKQQKTAGHDPLYAEHQAKHLRYQRNQIAFDLMKHLAAHPLLEPNLHTIKLDRDTLEKFAKQHIAYQRVLDYLARPQRDNGSIAFELLQNKAGYHFIYDQKIDWTVLRQEAASWQQAQQLTPQTRPQHAVKRFDVERIRDALINHPENTYLAILGPPKKRGAKEWRYGNGLVVSMKGKGAGQWYSFTEGKGGGPLGAIQTFLGLSFKDALKQGASLAGLTPDQAMSQGTLAAPSPAPSRIQEKERRQRADRQARIAAAQTIWDSTLPAEGTLAVRYLAEHRHITEQVDLTCRYWPIGANWVDFNGEKTVPRTNKVPALVIPIVDGSGKLTAVQRTYLDKRTAGKAHFMDDPKISKGIIQGSAGILREGKPGGRLYIAEGAETGGSLALIDKSATVLLSLSVNNLANMADVIRRYAPVEIIIAADNDGFGSPSHLATKAAFTQLQDQLSDVSADFKLIYPSTMPDRDKVDWNDVLITHGSASLAEQVKTAPGQIDHPALYYYQGENIAYTPAEHYLREIKGLTGVDLSLARYHPSVPNAASTKAHPAIIFPAMNAAHELSAELILTLDPEGKHCIDSRVHGEPAGSAIIFKQSTTAASAFLSDNIFDALSITAANRRAAVYVSLSGFEALTKLHWLFGPEQTIYITASHADQATDPKLYTQTTSLREAGHRLHIATGDLSAAGHNLSIHDALVRQEKVRGDNFIYRKALCAPKTEDTSLRARLKKSLTKPTEPKIAPKQADLSPASPATYYIGLTIQERDAIKHYFAAVDTFNTDQDYKSALNIAEKADQVFTACSETIIALRYQPQTIDPSLALSDLSSLTERVVSGQPIGQHDLFALFNHVATPILDPETRVEFQALATQLKHGDYEADYLSKSETFIQNKGGLIQAWRANDLMPDKTTDLKVVEPNTLSQSSINRDAWLRTTKHLRENIFAKQQQRSQTKQKSIQSDDDDSRGGRSY